MTRLRTKISSDTFKSTTILGYQYDQHNYLCKQQSPTNALFVYLLHISTPTCFGPSSGSYTVKDQLLKEYVALCKICPSRLVKLKVIK
jgi:hypothetical protein